MNRNPEIDLYDVHDDDDLEATRLARSEAMVAVLEKTPTPQAKAAARRLRCAIAHMRAAMRPAVAARTKRQWEETAKAWRS